MNLKDQLAVLAHAVAVWKRWALEPEELAEIERAEEALRGLGVDVPQPEEVAG